MVVEDNIYKYGEQIKTIMNNNELTLQEKSCFLCILLFENNISINEIAKICNNTNNEISKVIMSLISKKYIDFILNFKTGEKKLKIVKI